MSVVPGQEIENLATGPQRRQALRDSEARRPLAHPPVGQPPSPGRTKSSTTSSSGELLYGEKKGGNARRGRRGREKTRREEERRDGTGKAGGCFSSQRNNVSSRRSALTCLLLFCLDAGAVRSLQWVGRVAFELRDVLAACLRTPFLASAGHEERATSLTAFAFAWLTQVSRESKQRLCNESITRTALYTVRDF